MSVRKYMYTSRCDDEYCIGDCDFCDVWRYEEYEDEEPVSDDNAVIEEPHFATGFRKADKPYLQGYARGLRDAMRFCDEEQDPRAIKAKLKKLAGTVQDEANWLL